MMTIRETRRRNIKEWSAVHSFFVIMASVFVTGIRRVCGMHRFLTAVRLSLATKNWYSALFVALSLPDICGRLEDPTRNTPDRYKDWFRRYLSAGYGGWSVDRFLTAEDFYALRCAIVHEGMGDIVTQRSKKVLDEFCFFSPGTRTFGPMQPGHCTRLSNVKINDREFTDALCLHVTNFCEDICKAVEKWLADVGENPDVRRRVEELLTIY